MFDVGCLVIIDFNKVSSVYKNYFPKTEIENFKRTLKAVTGGKVLRVIRGGTFNVKVDPVSNPGHPIFVLTGVLIKYNSTVFKNLNYYF